MKWEHAKLGIKVEAKEVLLQEDVENFFRTKRRISGNNEINLSVMETVGNVVRAALMEGIVINGLVVEEVGKLAPSAASWLAKEVSDHIADAIEIPPE